MTDLVPVLVVGVFLALVFAAGAYGADRWEARWLGRLLELDGASLSWVRRRGGRR